MPARVTLDREYILSRIRVLPNGCWQWQKTLDAHGYGAFRAGGKQYKAHRAAYELWKGPTPLPVLHRCDNRGCCNPDHVRPGTHADNTADMLERGRHKTQFVPTLGHFFSDRARDLRTAGASHELIASWLGCATMSAWNACQGSV